MVKLIFITFFLASCGQDTELEIDSAENKLETKKLSEESGKEEDDWTQIEIVLTTPECKVLRAKYEACSFKYTLGRHDDLDYCLDNYYKEFLKGCCALLRDGYSESGKTFFCVEGLDVDVYEKEQKRSGL